jgi:hypothetical protein
MNVEAFGIAAVTIHLLVNTVQMSMRFKGSLRYVEIA